MSESGAAGYESPIRQWCIGNSGKWALLLMGPGQQQSTRPTDAHRARAPGHDVRPVPSVVPQGETMQANIRTTLQRIANSQFSDTPEVAA